MQSQARDARETGDIYPRGQVLAKECEMTLCSAEAYKLVSKKGKANDSATGNTIRCARQSWRRQEGFSSQPQCGQQGKGQEVQKSSEA